MNFIKLSDKQVKFNLAECWSNIDKKYGINIKDYFKNILTLEDFFNAAKSYAIDTNTKTDVIDWTNRFEITFISNGDVKSITNCFYKKYKSEVYELAYQIRKKLDNVFDSYNYGEDDEIITFDEFLKYFEGDYTDTYSNFINFNIDGQDVTVRFYNREQMASIYLNNDKLNSIDIYLDWSGSQHKFIQNVKNAILEIC